MAWLAFFALACQFVFSFGHVHLGSASSSASAISADAANGSAGPPSSPAHKPPTGLARDFCAVCNHISLASALVLPDSPAATPPVWFIQELQWSSAAIGFASRDHFYFDARGPPHA